MKSLETGPTKIVPVRLPEKMKAELRQQCEAGETLSAFLRTSGMREANRRKKAKQKRKAKR